MFDGKPLHDPLIKQPRFEFSFTPFEFLLGFTIWKGRFFKYYISFQLPLLYFKVGIGRRG